MSQLYEQIGKLQMELAWLKKNLDSVGSETKRSWIEQDHVLSIVRQCELLGLNRSTLYYEPAGESIFNLELMRLIDEQYTKTPFYGSRRMTAWLNRQGYTVNRKRIQRLMRIMGIEAIYPKPKTSVGDVQHKVYPYLLDHVTPSHPDHVWSTDITYIRMRNGFLYLVAVMDGYSRYVLSWELSNTLDRSFCLAALNAALAMSTPLIFNSDQGCQFTSTDFTGILLDAGVCISMDGRGRCFDNIFTERLWRTIKYEEVYLKDYSDGFDAHTNIEAYLRFYNAERLHQALDYRTSEEVYRNPGTK